MSRARAVCGDKPHPSLPGRTADTEASQGSQGCSALRRDAMATLCSLRCGLRHSSLSCGRPLASPTGSYLPQRRDAAVGEGEGGWGVSHCLACVQIYVIVCPPASAVPVPLSHKTPLHLLRYLSFAPIPPLQAD